jgi:hypothetical protein
LIGPIVYAEVSIAYGSIEELEGAIADFAFDRQALPWEAAFLAGKAFERYRRRGGSSACRCRISTSGRTRHWVA